MHDLGTLGGSNGRAIAVNDAGEVVGWAMDQNENVLAFLWKNGAMTNLGTLSPLPFSNAQWINSREQIVGFAAPTDFSSHVAFLWESGGPMVDLNTLIPPGSALQLAQALNINDRGEIAGDSLLSNGDHHAFLLIPCDENHPGVEGCDYSMVEAGAAATLPSPVRNASSRTLPPSLMRRMNRYRFPGPASDPRN